jgi:RNA polymerase sigma-70 factor (ECF subfamily)
MRQTPSLTERAKQGDASALTLLLRDSEPDLRRFAARVCRSSADADDAVSHAMTAIAFKLDGFSGLARLSTWLFTIVRNECAKYERLARRWVFGATDSLTDPFTSPEQASSQSQLLERVVGAVRELQPELREVFVARELEQQSVQECASALGLSEANVKVRLHRARAQLRAALGTIR